MPSCTLLSGLIATDAHQPVTSTCLLKSNLLTVIVCQLIEYHRAAINYPRVHINSQRLHINTLKAPRFMKKILCTIPSFSCSKLTRFNWYLVKTGKVRKLVVQGVHGQILSCKTRGKVGTLFPKQHNSQAALPQCHTQTCMQHIYVYLWSSHCSCCVQLYSVLHKCVLISCFVQMLIGLTDSCL